MKKIIVLLTLLLFINTEGFGREIIVDHRFIPIDLERTYLVSKCGGCGILLAIDSLLYSPKTQYYYYSNGEMCPLESIRCDNCKAQKEKQERKIEIVFYIIFFIAAIFTLFCLLLDDEKRKLL